MDAKDDFENALQDVYEYLPQAEKIVIESIGFSDDMKQTAILDRIEGRETALCGKPIPGPTELEKCLSSVIKKVRDSWEVLEKKYTGLQDQDKQNHQGEYNDEKTRWGTFDGTDRAKFEGALNNAVNTWQSIKASPFAITGGPFFADGDELIIKITVTRKAGLDARFLTSRTCSEKPVARLRTKGGIKVDFSAGFAFGQPVDRAYYLADNTDTPPKKVIKRNADNESFCAVLPAVFVHVYPRNGRDIALAGTFGIALNNSSVFDYYLGGSILFGASQRGVLTIGIGVRTISVLGAGLTEGQSLPDGITTIPVTNVIYFGYCVGLSFNLGGI